MNRKELIDSVESIIRKNMDKGGITREEAELCCLNGCLDMVNDQHFGLNELRIVSEHLGYRTPKSMDDAFTEFRRTLLQERHLNDIMFQSMEHGYTFDDAVDVAKRVLCDAFIKGNLTPDDVELYLWALGYHVDESFFDLSPSKQKRYIYDF